MSSLTPERLVELKRVAKEATPGPWETTEFAGAEARSEGELGVFAPRHPSSYQKPDGTWYGIVICRGMDGPTKEANAEYIAAFDPPTVLAMLDEIECLRAENAHLISDIKFITAPIEVGGGADAYLRYEVDRLQREVDELQSEFEEQNSMLGKTIIDCDDYLKQVDSLRGTLSELVNAVKRYNNTAAFSPGFDHAVARLHEKLSEAERVLEGGDGDE